MILGYELTGKIEAKEVDINTRYPEEFRRLRLSRSGSQSGGDSGHY
jgi:hypothetical protein